MKKIILALITLSLAAPILPARAAVRLLPSTIRSVATESAATISWATDSPSKTWLYFTATPQSPVWSEYKTDALVTAHTATLASLIPQQTYYFHIRTDDGVGGISEDKKATLFSTFFTGELNTVAALQARLAQLQEQLRALQGVSASSVAPAGTGSAISRTLKIGDRGEDVKLLQQKLTSLGIVVPVTGYFGPLTQAAVARFQERYRATILEPAGLSAGTGIVGPATRSELQTIPEYRPPVGAATAPLPISPPTGGTGLTPSPAPSPAGGGSSAATPPPPAPAPTAPAPTPAPTPSPVGSTNPLPVPLPPAPTPVPPPAPAPAPLPAFLPGDRVQTTAVLNVRSSGSTNAAILGIQQAGALGTIVAGGISANGFVWWQIDFDAGMDGWSADVNFVKSSQPVPTPAPSPAPAPVPPPAPVPAPAPLPLPTPPSVPAPSGSILQPGGGFAGATPQPSAIGSGQGVDATAIARWDVVPYQTFANAFNIGVVAFHINGINRVEFSVNGGPWTSVYQPTLNQQTNVVEYWATVRAADLPDGPFEVRAVAYPNAGIPRVLQGSIDGSLAYQNGIHSLFLNANSRGSLLERALWADVVNGNDTTGNGSQSAPFKTPGKALAVATQQYGSADGVTIYLMPGTYGWSSGGTVKADQRWATVAAAPGVNRSQVVFATSATGGLGGVKLLRAYNITEAGSGPRSVSSKPTFYWFDNSTAQGNDPYADGGVAQNWTGVYATDVIGANNRAMFRGVNALLRNASGNTFSDTPLNEDAAVINVVLDRFTRNPNGDHADVIHGFWNTPGVRENRVFYGLRVTNFDLQGFQMNSIRTGAQDYNNVAFKDVYIAKDATSVAGSWWSIDANHVVFDNVQFPDQPIRWQPHSQDTDGILTLKNFGFFNSTFSSFVFGPLPSDTRVVNTQFLNPSCFKCFVPGAGSVAPSPAPAPTPTPSPAPAPTPAPSPAPAPAPSPAPAPTPSPAPTPTPSPSVGTTVTSGLIARWPLDGNAQDVAGASHGTAQGGVVFSGGQVGQAAQFDGMDDWIDIGTPAAVSDAEPYTLSFWVKPSSFGGYVISKRNSATGYWRLNIDTAGAIGWFKDTSGSTNVSAVTNAGAVSAGQWQHLGLTWDGTVNGTGVRIYVNGVEAAYASRVSGTGSILSDAGNNLVFGSRAGTGEFFAGVLDDVRLYDRVLSSGEISQIYSAGQSGLALNDSSPYLANTIEQLISTLSSLVNLLTR